MRQRQSFWVLTHCTFTTFPSTFLPSQYLSSNRRSRAFGKLEAVGEDIAVAFDACFASWPGATSLRLAVPCVVGVGEESCSEIAVVGGVADVEVDDDD